MVGSAVALVLLAGAPLGAQSRGSLQASARVLPTPAGVVLDSAVQHGLAAARRAGNPARRLVRVPWAAVRLEADPRDLALRGRIVVTVSYVRN